MLTINPSPLLGVIGYAAEPTSVLIERVASHLRVVQTDRTSNMDDAELRRFVAAGSVRARGYGVCSERALASWMELAVVFGLEFDVECAWACACLDSIGAIAGSHRYGDDLVHAMYHAAANDPSRSRTV